MWSVRLVQSLVLEPGTYLAWKRAKASQAIPGERRESPFLLGTMLFTQDFSWGIVLLPSEKAAHLWFYG